MKRVLLLPLFLVACQDQEARSQNEALAARVTALEAQVRTLQAATEDGKVPANARSVTVQARAQNCATQLARQLEGYRIDSLDDRYPTEKEITLPPACEGQHLKWKKRTPQAYLFIVTDGGTTILARQSGP